MGRDWKAKCASCGLTFMASELRKNWKGFYVCEEDFEPRHPSYDLRAKVDKVAVPWTQDPPDRYVDPLDNYALNGVRAIFAPKEKDE